jgi:hypothetical protein
MVLSFVIGITSADCGDYRQAAAPSIKTSKQFPLWHRTNTPCVYLCYASLIRDGHHQKRECATNFFICLLVRCYRIDGEIHTGSGDATDAPAAAAGQSLRHIAV